MMSIQSDPKLLKAVAQRNGGREPPGTIQRYVEVVMVDGCFMVDGPCINHAEEAVIHVLWLTGL